jgi:putative peptidoglycan lipid II flippase
MPPPHERDARSAGDDTIVLPALAAQTVVLPVVRDPTEPESDSASDSASVARNSAVMAAGSIVSRATGFLRSAAIAFALGAFAVADDYTFANNLPNMVYELLLGGMLASVIVPVLVKAKREEADGGEAYTQRLLTLTTLLFGAATVLAVAAAPLITALTLTGNSDITPEDRQLITTLAYLLLPEIFFYGTAAMLAAILNVRGHFAAPMWTPILNNLVVTVVAVTFAVIHTGDLTTESVTRAEVLLLGIGTTLGIVIQTAGLIPALRKVGFRWRWRFDFRKLGLRELGRLGSWMLLYVAVIEVGVLVVAAIAKIAGDRNGPGVMVYQNAFLVFMMAHGIVAVSIMTALMPRMSAAAADGRMGDVAEQLSLGTRLSAVILIPASLAYLVLGGPLAIVLFRLGEYGQKSAIDTGWVIAIAGFALLPYAITQLQTAAFYALSDTKTPALISIPMVMVRILFGVPLLVLPAGWIAMGLMGSGAVSFVVGTALGYWVLRKKVGPLGMGRILRTFGQLTVAAIVGALLAAPVVWLLDWVVGAGKAASLLKLVIGGLVLLFGYVASASLLRVAEIKEVANLVGGKLRRGN